MKASKKGRRSSRLSEGSSTRFLDYSIQYPNKKSAAEILGGPKAPIQKVLTAGRAEVDQRQNRIYAGENREILRALIDDRDVRGKVSLVYIDPPFATGSSFESRDAEQAYEDRAVGATYLEFLRERLVLLRELLSDRGSIYVHLDGKMGFPAKILMDEVFGPGNFRNWITRKKSNRKNFTRKQYGNISDYILFYTKSEKHTWNRPYEAWTPDWMETEYPYTDDRGRRYKKVPIHAPGIRNGETGRTWRGKSPPAGKHWQYKPSKLDELDSRGEIYWSPTGNPRRKVYFNESKGVPVQDIWLDFRDAHNQMVEVTGYPTEKNLELLRRIVLASSNEGDLVLDCFMGSGTTVVAAEECDRRWIGIDSSMTAIDVTLKRLAHGSEPMGDFVNGKKKRGKYPELFARGPLKTGFDLYVTTGEGGPSIAATTTRSWMTMFTKC